MEYSETEIKMLDVGEALLISEPKIKFAVPMKVIHYPEYLSRNAQSRYSLPNSPNLNQMEERLRRLDKQSRVSLE